MYTITLENCPSSITEQTKFDTKYHFQRALERAFIEPKGVSLAYRIWQNAMKKDESEPPKKDKALTKRWIDMAGKTQTEELKEPSECEAHFKIHSTR